MLTLTQSTTRCARADAIISGALQQRWTAAVLRVESGGALFFERAYGTLDDGAEACRIDPSTAFDLASLTKVVVATAALRAVAEGRIALDVPLTTVVPEWCNTDRRSTTLRMLLAHTAGMASGADYRELLREDVEQFALRRELVAPAGERVVYSDLGFIALGCVLERVYCRSLASIVGATAQAAVAQTLTYRPRAAAASKIPATEDDGWRGRLRGVVHDEKAYLMGGVAGHAGLFGSALDVSRFAEAFLKAWRGQTSAVLPVALARAACEEAAFDPVLRRGLGWALRTTDENSCGTLMGPRTFGHTGFTGTCMWADPDRDLSIVLLTNAVYFGRSDVRELRAAVCDAVVEDVVSCSPQA
ncbi:MAG: serine hydrolase [Candidatus Eremiobacteraeota bacterium]|nr:serine hydrolase [Candidatus Eremiobacteraeota bacterium]